MAESNVRSAAHMTLAQSGLIGAALLVFLLFGGPAFGAADTEAPPSPPLQIPQTGMKDGRLTATHENSAEISGRNYAFHPKIEFGDDEGERRQWKEFKKGDQVQFHLKQEKVDYLILVPPK
jgi:hypothetical protein